ncbi:MAG: hypothetical protein H6634_09925 [Anaerolineales bacterium]|nr:hypothetical protein [Anaerolineales bacterium]
MKNRQVKFGFNNYNKEQRRFSYLTYLVRTVLILGTLIFLILQLFPPSIDGSTSGYILLVYNIIVILLILITNVFNIRRLTPTTYKEKTSLKQIEFWLILEAIFVGTAVVLLSNIVNLNSVVTIGNFIPIVSIIVVMAFLSMQLHDHVWREHHNRIIFELSSLVKSQQGQAGMDLVKHIYDFDLDENGDIVEASPGGDYLLKSVLRQRFLYYFVVTVVVFFLIR